MKFQLIYKENTEIIDISEDSIPMLINMIYIVEKLTGIHIAMRGN